MEIGEFGLTGNNELVHQQKVLIVLVVLMLAYQHQHQVMFAISILESAKILEDF